MLYIKYRPKIIADIDNKKVQSLIANILNADSLPHALLFIGQKGTGKTSTARIFARAVNCQKNKFARLGESFEPCQTCENCKSIDSSSNPDVIELDAASNRGIDDIKTLIKEAAFLPMNGKYRIFIIDEAHMITPDAFNALLKTLEEPPSTVIFILATTNREKIPKTIMSRCTIVNFGHAVKADIVSMLKRITKAEKLSVTPDLLSFIADHADSSFRDATKIFEELMIQKFLTLESAQKYLGLSKKNLWGTVEKGSIKEILSWINEFDKGGGDIKNLITGLLTELHDVLLFKHGVPNAETSELNLNTNEIVLLIKLLTHAYDELKISPLESLPLEIAFIEFYNRRNKT